MFFTGQNAKNSITAYYSTVNDTWKLQFCSPVPSSLFSRIELMYCYVGANDKLWEKLIVASHFRRPCTELFFFRKRMKVYWKMWSTGKLTSLRQLAIQLVMCQLVLAVVCAFNLNKFRRQWPPSPPSPGVLVAGQAVLSLLVLPSLVFYLPFLLVYTFWCC